MKKTDYFYDAKEDNLYIYKDDNSFGSVELGSDIVIDVNKNLDIIALEFFNASKVLARLTGKKLTKKNLSGIKNAKLISSRVNNLILGYYKLELQNEKVISDKITMQDFKYKSPVLARTT